jgi:hypothetical protein
MVMRVREAFRLFFDARTKKFQATGWKAIYSVEIHGTGAFGRRSFLSPAPCRESPGRVTVTRVNVNVSLRYPF